MTNSVAEALRRDLACEDLLGCVHGLPDLDRDCFRSLTEAEAPLTVDQIADQVDRERSTAYRSVHRLLDAGFVTKEQVNYEHGGYHHVYRPVDPDAIADNMTRLVNEWAEELTALIAQFREEYAERVTVETTPG